MIKKAVIIVGTGVGGLMLATGVGVGCGWSKIKSAVGTINKAAASPKTVETPQNDRVDQMNALSEKLRNKKKEMEGKRYNPKEVEALRQEFKTISDEMRGVLDKACREGEKEEVKDILRGGWNSWDLDIYRLEKLRDELKVLEESRDRQAAIVKSAQNWDFSNPNRIPTQCTSWLNILRNLQSEAEKYWTCYGSQLYFKLEWREYWGPEHVHNLKAEKNRWYQRIKDNQKSVSFATWTTFEALASLTDLFLDLAERVPATVFEKGDTVISDTTTELVFQAQSAIDRMATQTGSESMPYGYDNMCGEFRKFMDENILFNYSRYGLVKSPQ